MVNIQDTDIRASLDALTVSPPNTSLPSLDEKTISWVMDQPLAWMSPGFFGFTTNLFDIGVAQAVFLDDGGAGANVVPVLPFTYGTPITARQVRCFHHLRISHQGGVTNPMTGTIQIRRFGVSNLTLATYSVTNPGAVLIGPLIVPPLTQIRIVTTSGIAGDTIAITAVGTKGEPGQPLIVPPPLTITEGPV